MAETQKSNVQYITVDSDSAGRRIDNFLISLWRNVPKSRVYRVLRKGEVRVNKKRIKAPYVLREGDSVRLPPMYVEETTKPIIPKGVQKDIETMVLFETEELLVLNKPSGLAVHAGSGVPWGVIEALRAARPEAKFFELAHRLDRETSGCLVIAKKPKILRELHELLREGKFTKRYQTLTYGRWKQEDTMIEVALSKNQLSSGERMVKVDVNGKASKTVFHVREKFSSASFVDVDLYTGRTHQIRVHAKHAGHAVAGDSKYGDKAFNKVMRQFGLKRLFLHAASLSFHLPSIDSTISVESPLSDDLTCVLKALRG